MLTIDHLHKQFGSVEALNDVSFNVPDGRYYRVDWPKRIR